MDRKPLANLLEALGKDALQSMTTYHGIKAKGVEKQVSMLSSFYESNMEAFSRDLNRQDIKLLIEAVKSRTAREAAIKLTGKSDFAYQEDALQRYLEQANAEQIIGLLRSLFLKSKMPKELSALQRELSSDEKLRERAALLVDAVPPEVLNKLYELRGVKAARSNEQRRSKLLDAYATDLKLLVSEINATDAKLLPQFLAKTPMIKIAHQERGRINFSYRIDRVSLLLEEATEQEIAHLVSLVFIDGKIPEEFADFEFPLDENGRNFKEEGDMHSALLAAMDALPDDTTANPQHAIVLKQPWADLILTGQKKVEVRQHETSLRERVYIYVSAGAVDAQGQERCLELGLDHELLPRAMIIGTVQIIGCLPVRRGDAERSGGLMDTDTDGWFTWYLARPRRLKRDLFPKNPPQGGVFKPF